MTEETIYLGECATAGISIVGPQYMLTITAGLGHWCEMTFVADDGVEQTIRFTDLKVKHIADDQGRNPLQSCIEGPR